MAKFGARSKLNLQYLHPYLRELCSFAIQDIDFTVICSVRDRSDQEQAFHLKRSRAHFGQSPHNYYPALAFDFIPFPFVDADWENVDKFQAIADVIKSNAKLHGTAIVWGGDWVTFKDYPHIELEHWRDYLGHTYDSEINPHDVVEPYDAAKHSHR